MSGWTDGDLRAALEQAKAEPTRPPRARPGQILECAGCGRDSREVTVYQRKALDGRPLCRACYHRWRYRHDPELAERERQRGRRYQREHREEDRARCRRYQREHREEINARARRYRREHREEINARARRHRQEHREEINAYNRRYRQEHREEINAYNRRYRALKRGRKEGTEER